MNATTKDLRFFEWSQLADYCLAANPSITEEAFIAAGGRMAMYKRIYAVIAFPIIGATLDTENPVGWLIVNANGGTLPEWDKQGNIVDSVKMKFTLGSEPGLIGLHAIERLKVSGLVDLCWKVDGLTDLLALMSAIPADLADRHVVITNSNGTLQKLGWMAGVVAKSPVVNVVHDCDGPSQAGALRTCKDIAAQGGLPKNVVLPYPIEDKQGKGLRNWLGEPNTYANLCQLADKSETIEINKTAAGDRDYTAESWPV